MAINSVDMTDALESKGQVLEFYQTFSGASVSFKAFLKGYSENFSCKWVPNQVLGRPDPIQTYQGTGRSLSLDWEVLAYDLEDAESNLIKTSTLARMLYPEYSQIDSASTMSKGPLIKIKFANLIFDASRGPGGDVRTSGLLGVITSFKWAPKLDSGFFDPDRRLFPKQLDLGVQFEVLHQHTLGWEKAESATANPDAAPSWGADAALFPWSAGIQRANTLIGSSTVEDHPQLKNDENSVTGNT